MINLKNKIFKFWDKSQHHHHVLANKTQTKKWDSLWQVNVKINKYVNCSTSSLNLPQDFYSPFVNHSSPSELYQFPPFFKLRVCCVLAIAMRYPWCVKNWLSRINQSKILSLVLIEIQLNIRIYIIVIVRYDFDKQW